jgi:hypothetical protein
MEATRSSEASVYNEPKGRHIPEGGVLHINVNFKTLSGHQTSCCAHHTLCSVCIVETPSGWCRFPGESLWILGPFSVKAKALAILTELSLFSRNTETLSCCIL